MTESKPSQPAITEIKQPQPLIVEMPDRELLESFLRGLSGPPTAIFNRDLGKFEYLDRPPTLEFKTVDPGLLESQLGYQL